MENGKWKMENENLSFSPLLPRSSTPVLPDDAPPPITRVLYSYRFFGVGWTVTGAGVFGFQVSNLRVWNSRDLRLPAREESPNTTGQRTG